MSSLVGGSSTHAADAPAIKLDENLVKAIMPLISMMIDRMQRAGQTVPIALRAIENSPTQSAARTVQTPNRLRRLVFDWTKKRKEADNLLKEILLEISKNTGP